MRGLVSAVVGGVVGGILGAIVAVNIVIYAGPDDGYQAGLPDVFDHSPLVGTLTVATLVSGPVIGVVTAGRLRRARQ